LLFFIFFLFFVFFLFYSDFDIQIEPLIADLDRLAFAEKHQGSGHKRVRGPPRNVPLPKFNMPPISLAMIDPEWLRLNWEFSSTHYIKGPSTLGAVDLASEDDERSPQPTPPRRNTRSSAVKGKATSSAVGLKAKDVRNKGKSKAVASQDHAPSDDEDKDEDEDDDEDEFEIEAEDNESSSSSVYVFATVPCSPR
jgi:hypothetical protein